MARLKAAILAVFMAALIGCGSHEVTSTDVKAPDPYAGMTPAQKVDAIRADPKIGGMQKSQMISDAQKAGGQPVTGQ